MCLRISPRTYDCDCGSSFLTFALHKRRREDDCPLQPTIIRHADLREHEESLEDTQGDSQACDPDDPVLNTLLDALQLGGVFSGHADLGAETADGVDQLTSAISSNDHAPAPAPLRRSPRLWSFPALSPVPEVNLNPAPVKEDIFPQATGAEDQESATTVYDYDRPASNSQDSLRELAPPSGGGAAGQPTGIVPGNCPACFGKHCGDMLAHVQSSLFPTCPRMVQ